MKIQQIKSAAINALQHWADEMQLNIGVGPIGEDDWIILSRGYGELNWETGLTKLANSNETFDIVFKSLPKLSAIDAAILGRYDQPSEVLELHFIESFVRGVAKHPLRGRVFMLSILSAYLFVSAAGGKEVHLVDPFEETVGYYEQFGFQMRSGTGCRVMTISFENLEKMILDIVSASDEWSAH